MATRWPLNDAFGSSIGIDVAAPPELVFRLARDVTRWERLLARSATAQRVVRREADGALVCDFVARRVIVPWLGPRDAVALAQPDVERARVAPAPVPPRRGRDAGHGRDLDHRAGGRRPPVEIEHVFRPRVAAFAAVVDRALTRPIAGRTLATMRDLAEALAPDAAAGS